MFWRGQHCASVGSCHYDEGKIDERGKCREREEKEWKGVKEAKVTKEMLYEIERAERENTYRARKMRMKEKSTVFVKTSKNVSSIASKAMALMHFIPNLCD